MTTPVTTDWLLWILGAVVGGAGLLILLWNLRRDKSGGRPRCQKCWYDMTGLRTGESSTPQAITCPECGWVASSALQLLRGRRYWKRIVAGLLLLSIGGGTSLASKLQRDGWSSILPATVLVFLAPRIEDDDMVVVFNINTGMSAAPSHWVSKELERRDASTHLWAWQLRWAIRRSGALSFARNGPRASNWP